MMNYEYEFDQDRVEQQEEAYNHHQQQLWEQGYDDASAGVWNCCTTKSVDCSRYCKYLAGYLWGLEQATAKYHAECTSNLAILDSEDYEF